MSIESILNSHVVLGRTFAADRAAEAVKGETARALRAVALRCGPAVARRQDVELILDMVAREMGVDRWRTR